MATSLVTGLGGSAGFGENFLIRNDDGSTAFLDLNLLFPQGLNFYGTAYEGLFVNNNGSVTLAGTLGSGTPFRFPDATAIPIIAPYWADADTRGAPGGTTPGGTSTGTNLVWYDFDAVNHVFTATWDDIGFFSQRVDKLNAFQLRLIGVPDALGQFSGDFDIEFRYEAVNWTTGNASEGVDGLGGTVSRAGFSSGNGVDFLDLPQSGDQAAMLDLENASNIGDPGRFLYQLRNGTPTSTVRIADATVAEGNTAPNGFAAVVIELSAPAAVPVTVDYATEDATALAGIDYVARRGTVTFAPGVTRQTVFVEIIGDTAAELDKTFQVRLSNAGGVPIADDQASVTIRNDEGLVISDAQVLEGTNDGTSTTPMVFTVRLLSAAATPVTVDFATGIISASPGTDFLATTGTLSFAPGETEKTITVEIGADRAEEASQDLLVRLSGATGADIVDGDGFGTIVNDDGFVVDDLRVTEGTSTSPTAAVATIRLLSPFPTAASVDWSTGSAGATAGGDFTSASGTANFAPGQTTANITIPVIADRDLEDTESFFIDLSNATGVAISKATAVVTIIDDDGLVVSDVVVTEGTGGTRLAVFNVSLKTPLVGVPPPVVNYTIADGTAQAGFDYTKDFGTLTFGNDGSATVSITIATDATPEPDETFTLVLSTATGSQLATATALLVNDDGLSVADASIIEEAVTTTASVTVSLSAASANPVTVDWSTANGSATSGFDYLSAGGTLTFAPGETSQTVTVDVFGDTQFEGDETFRIVLSNPVGSALVDPSGTVTIINDDARPAPAVSVFNAAVTEGTGAGTTTLHVAVGLSHAADTPVEVSFATGNGTAKAGQDYTATTGTVTIPTGALSAVIEVPLLRDSAVEANETFTVTLSSPTGGAILGTAKATATILNDDAKISIAATKASLAEGKSGQTSYPFTLTRTGDTTQTHSLSWTVAGSGAQPADSADFVQTSGIAIFTPGVTSVALQIPVQGDIAIEADEGFTVTLSDPSSGTVLGTASAAGTILNDDFPATLAIAPLSASKPEGNDGGTTPFTFTITRAVNLSTEIDGFWRVVGVGANAAATDDFDGNFLPAGGFTLGAGETSTTISVNVHADRLAEAAEEFAVLLSTSSPDTVIVTGAALASIANDDTSYAIAATSAAKPEGTGTVTPYTFTVTRSGDTSTSDSVQWMALGLAGAGTVPANAADFPGGTFPGGTLVFAAGQSSQLLTVNVNADPAVELNERFLVVLTEAAGSAGLGTASAPGLILNDDVAPVLGFTGGMLAQAEGNGGGSTPYSFTVTRTGNIAVASSAKWTVAGRAGSGTGLANAADFTGAKFPTGTVAFAVGETSRAITVNVAADALPELNERFAVTLSSAVGATIAPAAASIEGVIRNDDTILAITAGPGNKAEGSGGGTTPFTFTITRSGNNGQAATAQWAVAGATGSGTTPAQAKDFADGVFPTGIVSFAAGDTSKTVTINVNADSTVELNERFALTLSAPTGGAVLGTATLISAILNDDSVPMLAASAPDWSDLAADLIPALAPPPLAAPQTPIQGTSSSSAGSEAFPNDPPGWFDLGNPDLNA